MKIEAGDFGTAGSLLFQLFLWNKCLHCIFNVWGIERSGFFNGREKWAKGFENQRV